MNSIKSEYDFKSCFITKLDLPDVIFLINHKTMLHKIIIKLFTLSDSKMVRRKQETP